MPGGPIGAGAVASLDNNQVIDEILPTLHAASRADLSSWSEADLIQWADEAVKRLARTACVFVGRSTAITTVPGQATYTLPADHISTLHVAYSTQALRGANAIELEGRDEGWKTTQGTPASWYEDLLGMATIGLAPVPDAAQPLPVVYEGFPEALDAGKQQTMVPAPAPLKAYIGMSVIAAAYEREGEMEMPDVAAHARGRLQLYEQMLTTYYGKAL
jgi:hypothetical protein